MHKILLSVSLFSLLTGCSAILDLKDVQIVDGGSESSMDGTPSGHTYHCGYATPGHNCDNGRSSKDTVALDMTAAIAACKKQKPMSTLDFCYVKDSDGPAAADASECTAGSGSWRPNSNCCNFMGTLSCPD
jgi:hypothetical protein